MNAAHHDPNAAERFTECVRTVADLGDEAADQQAVVAVLAVLGDHLTGAAARRLGESLPATAALPLLEASETAASGDLDDFYARVRERTGLPEPTLTAVVAGVMRAVAETATADVVESAGEQLPLGLRLLLMADVGTSQVADGPIPPGSPHVTDPGQAVIAGGAT